MPETLAKIRLLCQQCDRQAFGIFDRPQSIPHTVRAGMKGTTSHDITWRSYGVKIRVQSSTLSSVRPELTAEGGPKGGPGFGFTPER